MSKLNYNLYQADNIRFDFVSGALLCRNFPAARRSRGQGPRVRGPTPQDQSSVKRRTHSQGLGRGKSGWPIIC